MNTEPVVIANFLGSLLALAALFGFHFQDATAETVKSAGAIFLTFALAALHARSKVTPTAKLGAPKPPSVPPVVGVLALFVCYAMLVAGTVLGCSSCSPAANQLISSEITAHNVEAGCSLVGLAGPSGQEAATVCEDLAPVLAPIIAELVGKLGSSSSASPLRFVPIKVSGKTVGFARADIAPAVQARAEAAFAPAAAK